MRKFGATLLALVALVGVGEMSAQATTKSTGELGATVSCDAVTIHTGVTVQHRYKGTVTIKQNSASRSGATTYWAVSDTGKALQPSSDRVSGETATWTNVLPGTYTAKMRRTVSTNCNGFLPGNGNYDLTYTMTYQG